MMMDSGTENEGLIPSSKNDAESQFVSNNTERHKSVPTPSPFTNWYHPTPSPADSGVMSPLTPLSNYTNVGGPNCTPEQNVVSSPEHSIASFAGYPISNGYGSTSSSVPSPYNNFGQFVNPSLTDPTISNNPQLSCSTIQSCSNTEEIHSTSNVAAATEITSYVTNHDSNERVQNMENNFPCSTSYNNCQPLPPFCATNAFGLAQQNWNDYSRNYSSMIELHKNSSQPFLQNDELQNENLVRIRDSADYQFFLIKRNFILIVKEVAQFNKADNFSSNFLNLHIFRTKCFDFCKRHSLSIYFRLVMNDYWITFIDYFCLSIIYFCRLGPNKNLFAFWVRHLIIN